MQRRFFGDAREAVLAEIARNARNARNRGVRLEAIRGLFDEELLCGIAQNADDQSDRLEAAGRVRNSAVSRATYSDIARNARERRMRVEAIRRLDDQAVLDDIANNLSDEEGVRLEARKKLAELRKV